MSNDTNPQETSTFEQVAEVIVSYGSATESNTVTLADSIGYMERILAINPDDRSEDSLIVKFAGVGTIFEQTKEDLARQALLKLIGLG